MGNDYNNQLNECLQKCDLGQIKLGYEADNASKFYGAIIRQQSLGLHYFGIGICSEGYGLTPHILMLPNSHLMLCGFNSEVVAINVNEQKIAFKISLNSLFYYFLHQPEKQLIIIIQELDVMAITEDGNKLWTYGKDVITHTTINGDNLHLQFMDESLECLNIFTGKKQFVTL